MKNVLIPTDFTAQSLELVSKTAQIFQHEKFNTVLFHAFDIPQDIMNLLFIGREQRYNGLITDDFRNQCKKIKHLYFDNINTIRVRYMYGSTVRLFKNFADANNIDLIVAPEDLRLSLPHQHSVKPYPLFKKSGIKVLTSFDQEQEKVIFQQKRKSTSFSISQM